MNENAMLHSQMACGNWLKVSFSKELLYLSREISEQLQMYRKISKKTF